MPKRLAMLALTTTLVGAGALQHPQRLHATYMDPKEVLMSCCEARVPYSGVVMRCCSTTGCIINQYGCYKILV
jgi:hypothetical protein